MPEKPQFSRPFEQLPPLQLSLGELGNQRRQFSILPSFQRQEVWPVHYQQALIDTILLGEPVVPLEFYKDEGEQGAPLYMLTDGHQRISAILEFMDGFFKTWTFAVKRRYEPNSEPPVEPGKFFEQLDPRARNHFLFYRLQFNEIRKRSEQHLVTRFLRIQNHVSLSPAEKLNAYISKAKDAAKLIESHDLWGDIYTPKTNFSNRNRMEKFQSSLWLLALELSDQGIRDVASGTFMHKLAAGMYDNKITDSVVDGIIARLDVICHVFQGTQFSVRATSIPMYQAVRFLERTGYTFQAKDKGRLTPWISSVILEASRASGLPSYAQPLQKLTHESSQKAFWEKHYKTVMKLFGKDEAA